MTVKENLLTASSTHAAGMLWMAFKLVHRVNNFFGEACTRILLGQLQTIRPYIRNQVKSPESSRSIRQLSSTGYCVCSFRVTTMQNFRFIAVTRAAFSLHALPLSSLRCYSQAWVDPKALPKVSKVFFLYQAYAFQGENLKKYSLDLTTKAETGKLDPVIGRDEEIRRTIQVLSRRTKNNPVLCSF
jgi:ATP-dependent Clp protease ATP-binding subunit ClpA